MERNRVRILYDYVQPEYEGTVAEVKMAKIEFKRRMLTLIRYDGTEAKYDAACVTFELNLPKVEDLPPIPETRHKCYCEMNVIMNQGCKCGGL